ncbi:MAG: hypothetical protein JWM93_3496 [Frankiales bacterium]|nr:hypothetical protein [Frankiales bacterium]
MADVPLRPLVPAEESWLVAELSQGRRPTVHVLVASGDLPAGARARVLSAAPTGEGEYLTVEVKGDRLPFAAPELALPPTVARRVRKAAGVVDPPPKPARRTTKKAAPVKAAPVKATPVKAAPVKAAPAKATPVKAAPVKAGRKRAPTPISVTIAFDGVGRWTVEARAGSRRLRPVEIPAGAAAAASDALGVPDVDALVTTVTDAMRRDAEQRASGLRAQLAAAEAELARLSR